MLNLLQKTTQLSFSEQDLNDVFRLGKKSGNCRPILASFTSHMKLKAILNNRSQLKSMNVGVSQDSPKEIIEERKKLQPLVSFLNKSDKKAYMRVNEILVDGKKLSKEETEEAMKTFHELSSKRLRTPENIYKRRTVPRLYIEPHLNPSKSNRGNQTSFVILEAS